MLPATTVPVIGLLARGVSVRAIIELGFLRGDPKTNAFGPPPTA